MASCNLHHFASGLQALRTQPLANGNHIGEGKQEEATLGTLPGSHLLLVWELHRFVALSQCPVVSGDGRAVMGILLAGHPVLRLG